MHCEGISLLQCLKLQDVVLRGVVDISVEINIEISI
jgi:hypothetical protein